MDDYETDANRRKITKVKFETKKQRQTIKKVYSKQATLKLAISGWKQLQNIKNKEITMTTDQ